MICRVGISLLTQPGVAHCSKGEGSGCVQWYVNTSMVCPHNGTLPRTQRDASQINQTYRGHHALGRVTSRVDKVPADAATDVIAK